MGTRTTRHLIGAALGLAAGPAIAFLFLDAIQRTAFLSIAIESPAVPSVPAGPGFPLHSAWLATAELLAAGALAGFLAAARWISPVASLAAAAPLLAIHFYGHSSFDALAQLFRNAPAGLSMPLQDVIFSDAFLLLGGALVISAAAPWRWRTAARSQPWANWHAVGVIVGMAAVPGLWFILQLSQAAASNLGPPGVITFEAEYLLFMVAGLVVIGLLASARWLSPVSAMIGGAPLLAVGLFGLVAPGTTRSVIERLVYGVYWQPATETLAVSGWLVLFGGLLLTAGVLPGRWRQDPGSVQAVPEPTPEPALDQAANPGSGAA